MNSASELQVTFRGVRGSVPTPCAQNVECGGNTTCLEVRLPGGETMIVDSGTGIRSLSAELREKTGEFHVFLTHFHWDHIQGLPFFKPLYRAESSITFYSMKAPDEARKALGGVMSVPYYPLDFRELPSRRYHVDISEEPAQFGESTVSSFSLNHPQGCAGYAFCHGGSKVIFASDMEHGVPEFDRNLLEAARDADILIYDAQYTPQEYEHHRGWGHSTWLEGTRVAREAGVKKLVLFHHDPNHSDETMRSILSEAREHFAETYLAIEGETLSAG